MSTILLVSSAWLLILVVSTLLVLLLLVLASSSCHVASSAATEFQSSDKVEAMPTGRITQKIDYGPSVHGEFWDSRARHQKCLDWNVCAIRAIRAMRDWR